MTELQKDYLVNLQFSISPIEAATLSLILGFELEQRGSAGQQAFICYSQFARQHPNSYCSLPYPDICICGQELSPTGNNLRAHCNICQGRISNYKQFMQLAYIYLPTCKAFGIFSIYRQSWVDYIIATVVQSTMVNGGTLEWIT